MYKVSIIISTFNRKDSVVDAIDSVLTQTFKDLEVIVVDDHSSDDTVKILKELYEGDNRVKIVELTENSGGPAKPRNEGIIRAKGQYIGFLDDDNKYKPDHVACLVNELDRDNTLDIVYGDRYVINSINPEQNGIGIARDFDSELLMKQNYIDTSDFLIRREALFEIGGWDEGHRRMLDWNLVARLDKAGKKFKHIAKPITDYYVHEGMLSEQSMDNEWCIINLQGVKVVGAQDCEVVLPYLGPVDEPNVAIFTITYGRLLYTQESFASLHETAEYPFTHYVIDNGSDDGTVEWLKEYEAKYPGRVHLIFNEDNKGISIASNIVLKAIKDSGVKFDIIGKFDNDAYCQTKGWLAAMVSVYKANHKLALSCYISGLRDSAGGVPRYVYGKVRNELLGMTKHLGGICCFTDAKIRLSFQLDESDTLHTSDDLFFSKYIQERGYQMAYLENYYINHGPKGTASQELDYPFYFKKRYEFERTHAYDNKL